MFLLFLFLLSSVLPGRAAEEVPGERDCGSNICFNGGTCRVNDAARSFHCVCPAGFSGKLCQDVCSIRCVNGACAKDKCLCEADWSGPACDHRLSASSSFGCNENKDCPANQICHENERGERKCMADPCEEHPCHNNATCVPNGDDYRCEHCSEGFGGKTCDDINECELSPCRNSGTCINMEGSFECLCNPPYIGKLCSDTPCNPNPCQNNGTCVEAMQLEKMFQCLCDDGYMGETCSEYNPNLVETPDPCRNIPCLNGGTCSSNASSYICHCRPEFDGSRCEQTVECTVGGQKCLNGGKCIQGLGSSRCQCSPDFSGILCESVEMPSGEDFCARRPCSNGGTCEVVGEQTVCRCPPGYQGPTCAASSITSVCSPNPCQNEGHCEAVGDPVEGGFVCHCLPPFTGYSCETNANEWVSSVSEIRPTPAPERSSPRPLSAIPANHSVTSQPVQTCEHCIHSDKCIENPEGSLCICRPGYFGYLCDKEGSLCSSLTCPSGQICRPRVSPTGSDFGCGCPIGKSGEHCNRENMVSFGSNSLFVYQSPSVMLGSSSGPLPYSLSYFFRTTLPGAHLVSAENIFGQRLFSLSLREGSLSVNISGTVYDRLLTVPINDGEWYSLELQKTEKDILVTISDADEYEYLSRSLPRPSSFDIFSTRIGKTADEQFFVGCMADVLIDKSPIDLANSNRAVAVSAGCSRIPQCAANRCHNGGVCIDMWSHSECDCKAPFLPPLCMYSLPPSTFGHMNLSSHAEIVIASEHAEHLKLQTDLRLIARTNKPDGALLYAGESSAEDGATFIAVGMVNGTLTVKSKIGSKNPLTLRSRRRLDDNEDHSIRVDRTKRKIRLFVDGVVDAEGDVPSRFDHPLFIERIQLGSSEGTPTDAFDTKDYFKGSFQDVRLNSESVVLHRTELNVDGVGRVTRLENVLEGTISDDICSTGSPCVKGSCRNTFNDFECVCNMGYYGRNCDQKDYCISSPCPAGGNCMNVGGGFLCTSPVTLVRSSMLSFKLQTNGSTDLDVIELSIRTHSQEGRILTLLTPTSKVMLSLSYGQLVVSFDSPFTIRKTINDGNWNRLSIQGNVLKINNASYGLPSTFVLPKDVNSATLSLGQMGGTASFEGCLQNVQIGKLPKISFYREEDLKIPEGLEHWKGVTRRKVTTDCLSANQCGTDSPCLNNGVCLDSWNQFHCQCLPGFTGSRCEVNFDECQNIDCGNGRCVDEAHNYRCECDPGFGGIACDITLDLCAELPCRNDGYCVNGNGTFSCQCRGDWVGKTCNIKKPVSCSPSPCQHGGACQIDSLGLKCQCPTGYIGEFCEEVVDPCQQYPCQHGSCQSTSMGQPQCRCDEGYAGATCSAWTNLCTTDTCSGRGICRSIWNGTICDCSKGWTGRFCRDDVDECLSIPCENDGTCANTIGGYHCKCRKYYLGDHCEVEGSCLRSPCLHGECIQMKHDEHSCSCQKGFEGLNCENKIDYCKRNPCKNGATCESLVGEHLCHCIPGFNGTSCEHDIDECVFGYCSNGSMCRDRVNDYDCVCDGTGYQGKNCTEDIDECAISTSCLNGICTNTNGGYKCDCEQGYIGRRCSVLDPCARDRFNRTTHSCVHGKCVNPGVRMEHGHETAIHECKCDRGYAGPQCSTKVDERRLIVLGYILPYVAGGLVLLCLLGCILFFVVWKGKHAYHGHYSPSHQETNGRHMQMNHMIKLPPEERLI